jgi:hypothetical protein
MAVAFFFPRFISYSITERAVSRGGIICPYYHYHAMYVGNQLPPSVLNVSMKTKDVCVKDHECGEEMLLPMANSPRAGVCGYTGQDPA